MFIDRLIAQAQRLDSRLVVGLDPAISRFPAGLRERLRVEPHETTVREVIVSYLQTVIQATHPYAVAYKPQVACFEQYGLAGMQALADLLAMLRREGIPIILDGKRGDVAHTATAYAVAWLAPRHPPLDRPNPWQADALTVNAYLGEDGVTPFREVAPEAGLFILAKTSNPSSGQLQDAVLREGDTVAERLARLVAGWGQACPGRSGYANLGLVVGATYPAVAARLRAIAPALPFLMPGIGVQEGSLAAIGEAGGRDGLGAYAASARSILYPPAVQALDGPSWSEAAVPFIRQAAADLVQRIRAGN